MEELALTNLTRPWILARLACGVAAAGLVVHALRGSLRVLRHWRLGATSEGQLALERRAELVAALVQMGLVLSLLGLTLFTLGADRSAASIRGAMCAYGVLASSPVGIVALGSGELTALVAALWLVLHRLDLRLERPTLTRRKFVALLGLAPLVVVDQLAFAAFALDLDFGRLGDHPTEADARGALDLEFERVGVPRFGEDLRGALDLDDGLQPEVAVGGDARDGGGVGLHLPLGCEGGGFPHDLDLGRGLDREPLRDERLRRDGLLSPLAEACPHPLILRRREAVGDGRAAHSAAASPVTRGGGRTRLATRRPTPDCQ